MTTPIDIINPKKDKKVNLDIILIFFSFIRQIHYYAKEIEFIN